MKKLIISLLLATFIISCATAQVNKPDPHSSISIENIKKKCEPSENWNVNVLGTSAFVLRFNDCLDIKTLLVISTDTENLTNKIRRSSIDLLAIHYIEYLKRPDSTSGKVKNLNKIYSIKKIKEELDKEWLTYFFKITYKKGTQLSETSH